MAKKEERIDPGVVEEPKGSGRWFVRIYHAGVRYKRRAASKSHAKNLREEIRVAIRKGEWPPKPKPKRVLVRDLVKEYRKAKEREGKSVMSSKVGYTRLTERFGYRAADSLTTAEIERWRADLLESVSPARANRYLALLRAVLRRAVRDRRVEQSALPEIKLVKENNRRVRYLTDDEERRLLQALPVRLRPLITVAINTGMRRSELLNLMWPDVDFVSGTIFVRTSKSGEGRRVPMSPTAYRTLNVLKEARRKRLKGKVVKRETAIPRVFAAPEGGFLCNFSRAWYPALKKAKLEDLRFHDLRHTFASRLVMRGVTLYEVQTLLGHKSPTMTLRYAHLSPKQLRAAVAALDARGPKPWAAKEPRKRATR